MSRAELILRRLNSISQKIAHGVKKNELIYRFVRKLRLPYLRDYLFSYLSSLSCHKNPTQEMKDEKQFFSEHAQELKMAYDLLEDARSKFVFENILKYRVTSNWAYLKKSRAKGNLKSQYFVPELKFSDHEIIVDCGAYTGDTVNLFYRNIPGCKVIALEPDEKNFEALQKIKLEGLKSIKAGVWSEDTTLSFSGEGGGTKDGAIVASGNTIIAVRSLDHIIECQSATYIKMDVEGAELEALKGAKKIIKDRKPKLAVCIYHKPQDFFEIPLYIKELNPDYKLFIYHHNPHCRYETVLYAV